jgi:hypothetical protein
LRVTAAEIASFSASFNGRREAASDSRVGAIGASSAGLPQPASARDEVRTIALFLMLAPSWIEKEGGPAGGRRVGLKRSVVEKLGGCEAAKRRIARGATSLCRSGAQRNGPRRQELDGEVRSACE